MPKDTFFNLPKEKIDKIIEVALDEFANFSYDNASINRIVEGAEIAKGSFYQYFEDKKDLYEYIVEESYNKKFLYLSDVIENIISNDFFTSLKQLYNEEIKFTLHYPRLSTIILDYTKNSQLFSEKILSSDYRYREVFEKLISKAIDNKEIENIINIENHIFLLKSLNISILEYYIKESKYDIDKTSLYIGNIIYLYKNGIKLKARHERNVEDRFY